MHVYMCVGGWGFSLNVCRNAFWVGVYIAPVKTCHVWVCMNVWVHVCWGLRVKVLGFRKSVLVKKCQVWVCMNVCMNMCWGAGVYIFDMFCARCGRVCTYVWICVVVCLCSSLILSICVPKGMGEWIFAIFCRVAKRYVLWGGFG